MSGTAVVASLIVPGLLASASLPALHAANGAQDASDVEVLSAQADSADRLTIPVRIGSHGPYRFLVDTGAQTTVVSSALAADLALPGGPAVRLVGVAGEQRVETVEIEELFLGRRSASGLLAPLLERGDIGADGILGIDSLQDRRVLFDFARNAISVDEVRSGRAGYEIVVRGRRKGHQLLITDAAIDGVRTRVVIDTGAESSIGNRALQKALTRKAADAMSSVTVLTSVTGQRISAEIGRAKQLQVGDVRIRNLVIAFADAPAFESLELGSKPALLLGMRELRGFKRVMIDFSTWRVLFDLPGL